MHDIMQKQQTEIAKNIHKTVNNKILFTRLIKIANHVHTTN